MRGAFRLFFERLAATYSRGIYKTTTIGKTVFDGRVRNGIGSDHSFMATKNLIKSVAGWIGDSLKTAHRRNMGITCSRVEIADLETLPCPLPKREREKKV